MAAADGEGARRDEQDVLAAGAVAGDVRHERVKPGAADVAGRLVDEQGRADLDDEAAGGGERLSQGRRPSPQGNRVKQQRSDMEALRLLIQAIYRHDGRSLPP